MGRLTTHVLDTAAGKPAAAIPLRLVYVGIDGSRTELLATQTNRDGRTDRPLLEGLAVVTVVYELSFTVKDYFAKTQTAASELPFLDVVTVRFCIAKATEHYHVPLLVSPWSYTTYRGS